MPPDPLDAMCLHTQIFIPLPLLTLIKPYFALPLSYFLDEGLVTVFTWVLHASFMYMYIINWFHSAFI